MWRPKTCNFIKKESPAEVFSCEIYEIFKNISGWQTFIQRFLHSAAKDAKYQKVLKKGNIDAKWVKKVSWELYCLSLSKNRLSNQNQRFPCWFQLSTVSYYATDSSVIQYISSTNYLLFFHNSNLHLIQTTFTYVFKPRD